MKDWDKCLEHDMVKERSENPAQARNLLKMARIRLEDNKRREKTEDNISLIVESYWEVIKQMITSLIKLEGYKCYSQECLISYLKQKQKFSQGQISLLNQLRKLRNDIDYEGEFLDKDYLDRNEENIEEIVEELENSIKNRIRS